MSSDFTPRPGAPGLSRAPRPPGKIPADTPISAPGIPPGPGRPCPRPEPLPDDLPPEEDPPDSPDLAEGPLPRPAGRPRRRRLAQPLQASSCPLTPAQRLLLLDAWRRSGLPARDFA